MDHGPAWTTAHFEAPDGKCDSAPFPSAVVVFTPENTEGGIE